MSSSPWWTASPRTPSLELLLVRYVSMTTRNATIFAVLLQRAAKKCLTWRAPRLSLNWRSLRVTRGKAGRVSGWGWASLRMRLWGSCPHSTGMYQKASNRIQGSQVVSIQTLMASYKQWLEDFIVNQHIKLLRRRAHNPSRKSTALSQNARPWIKRKHCCRRTGRSSETRCHAIFETTLDSL